MKFKSSILPLSLLLFAPAFASANIDSAINAPGHFITGTDSQIEVVISNFQNLSNSEAVLTLANTEVYDIKYGMVSTPSGWSELRFSNFGADVVSKLDSSSGLDLNGQRVISIRIYFKTPKIYVLGWTLKDLSGQTVSSAASPIEVNGSQILGQSIYTFTRNLRYGLRGEDVIQLQKRLTVEGVYTGPITGFFGRLTQAAVKKYQSKYGIQAIGIVGPETLAKLNQ